MKEYDKDGTKKIKATFSSHVIYIDTDLLQDEGY